MQQFDNNGTQPYLVIQEKKYYGCYLEYLPDGRRVVTHSSRGTVRVWNLESGKQEGALMEQEGFICGLSVTRDGTKIIITSNDDSDNDDSESDDHGRINVWDVESHKLVKEWTHTDSCTERQAISPDDRLLAVGSEDIAIWTMEGRLVDSVKIGDYVWRMCFSPDGNKLACATNSNGVRVYDVASGTLILQVGPSDTGRVGIRDLLWSRDGSKLFASAKDNTIRCWNSDTGQQIGHPWTGHTHYISSFSLSPDGSTLASASFDKTVRFWNATTGDPIGQLQHDCEVNTVRFSPSGESVASAGVDGKIRFWRVPWLNWRVSTLRSDVPHYAYSSPSPSNRQSLLTSTRRTTPRTACKCPSFLHLHHTPLVCAFPTPNKCWVSVLM